MVLKLDVLYKSPYTTFENDVKMYGTQTVLVCIIMHRAFENDVKMYGTQTEKSLSSISISLRMM